MTGAEGARLTTVVERAPMPIYLLDRAGRFAYVNESGRTFLGDERSVIGQRAILRVHPDDREGLLERLREESSTVVRVAKADGTFRALLLCAVDTRRETGWFVLSQHELTALHDTEKMLANISHFSLDAIVAVDERGRVLAWNPHAQSTFGWSAEEAIGRPIEALVVPAERHVEYEEVFERLATADVASMARRAELVARHRNGRELPVELTVCSSMANDRKIYQCLFRDLTETRLLQAQLFQAQKFEALGALAGSIAHDFNNIIAAISTFTTLALPSVSGDVRDDLDQVLKATHRATRLTQQLLGFARQQNRSITSIDMGARIRELEPMLRRLAGPEIALHVELPAEGPFAELDPSQLEQIVVNLVVNARDAMADGGTVSIKSAVHEGQAWLYVNDTGHGISERDRSRIFEPFFTTKTEGRGTGLGLSTVFGIVKQNNGTLDFESKVGFGSTFSVRFPTSATVVPVERPSETKRDDKLHRGSETVLLVEDDDLVRLACFRALDGAGYRVFEAHNAGEAIILAEDQPRVDLLVTDVALPRVDGRQLARHMKRIHPETKVLFVSGYNESDARVSAVQASDSHFLAKPFTPHSLLSKVRETLTMG